MKECSERIIPGLGEKIHSLIIRSGKTQRDYATMLGLKEPTLCSYIKGRLSIPLPILIKICEIEDISLDEICGRKTYIAYILQYIGKYGQYSKGVLAPL